MAIRQTSILAYNYIKENGLLSERRQQVYEALFEYGPCTASELFYKMRNLRNPSHSNVTTRLGELRDLGCVAELGRKICNITGREVIEWDVTAALPAKFDKVRRTKCKSCNGTGYQSSQQTKLF